MELPKETIERKHTPLPWIVRSLKNEYHEGCFVECEKETINKPYGQEILSDDYHEGLSKEDDAKFIVEACNSYYELQDRLKVKHQVNVDLKIQLEAAKSEALRSLSEIEKQQKRMEEALLESKRVEQRNLEDLRNHYLTEIEKLKEENGSLESLIDALESQNKEMMEALKEMVRCCAIFKENLLLPDITLKEALNATNKAKSLLKSLPNKEA